jgi:DNA-binding phage protein
MSKIYGNHDEYLMDQLNDPEYANLYLNAALEDFKEDQDVKALFRALTSLALSKSSSVTRQHLYELYNDPAESNSETFFSLLDSAGYEFKAVPKK